MPKTVLIIDDDAAIRDAVILALDEQHLIKLRLHQAANVDAGLAKAKELKPDLIILDLHMPGKTGFDFMDDLHATDQRDTPVLMLTGDDTMDNIFTAEDKGIGMYHVLGKPFNIDELQAMVYKLVIRDPANKS